MGDIDPTPEVLVMVDELLFVLDLHYLTVDAIGPAHECNRADYELQVSLPLIVKKLFTWFDRKIDGDHAAYCVEKVGNELVFE